MLQQRLYTLLKWVLSLSFADVMCFFISVYLLIRVSEKCQNILFLLLKRRKILDFHSYGVPSYFSFSKQSFIAPHTIISEVCFSNREFHSFFGVILGVILCFWRSFLHSWASFFILGVSFLLISRKNKLVNTKKCFTNNVLCKFLITFVWISTHLTEKNEQLFNDIQSFWQLQEPESSGKICHGWFGYVAEIV